MATLYLSEQGAIAHKIGQRVVVTRDERVIADVPLFKIDQIRVLGRGITLTSALMVYVMEQGIDTVFFSQAQRYRGRLLGRDTGHGALRVRQARAAGDEAFTLALARSVVAGKLVNQRFLLRRHGAADATVRARMAGIDALRRRCTAAPTLDGLRGFEGQAAALYFAAFRRLLRHDLGFVRRAQHPPTDPVNALLSFGYTLLLGDVNSAVYLVGLDPAVGFLHAVGQNRPALALDLMEEFRALLVDTVVLALVNGGSIGPSDIRVGEDPARPVLLGDRLRDTLVRQYGERLDTVVRYPATGERTNYRRILELQARALARALEDGVTYRAFTAQ